MKQLFITGINTEVGKTIASAVLVQATGADYWKPVQAGDLDNSDTDKVKNLVSKGVTYHPEAFQLQTPISPHAAAEREGKTIVANSLKPPNVEKLIIEGAGGLLSPISIKETMLDLILHFNCEAVLVIKHYLGSINHTLMTLNELKRSNINVKGLIISGEPNPESEEVIFANTNYPLLGRIPQLTNVNVETIAEQATQFEEIWI